MRKSSRVYVPSGVSSFFEICDRNPDGSAIQDISRIGARGGGFIIRRGNVTQAYSLDREIKKDAVLINGQKTSEAKTTLRVIEDMRKEFDFGPVKVTHQIEPPIGAGFGTSGAGAVGTAIALSDLLGLNLTLSQASEFAHCAEVESVTGLGTVISLVSGLGAVGLVTEPGSFSVGRVDSLLGDHEEFNLICACFGPIIKSSVIKEPSKVQRVNEYGRKTLKAILQERTFESLLKNSRIFAEKTGLASPDLLRLADKAMLIGAVGATQNMIGNAIHCLVPKTKKKQFLDSFSKLVSKNLIFQTELVQSGPVMCG